MPIVSVITRTKDRPALLGRALESLKQQSFRDFAWIVANDSADGRQIEPVLTAARSADIDVRVRQVDDSKGMESASNRALELVDTTYVTFLDDDDTWEPAFLEETVGFLEAHPEFGGVCTHTSIVEETSDAIPAPIRQYVMNADLQALQLADMMVFNHLTTNSFVYRTALHETLGPYREDLPVMGDWEFGIRLVAAHEVGVIAKPLANYHRRIDASDPSNALANTVVSRTQLHALTDARLRNELLRQEWTTGSMGPGHLMALARIQLRADRLEHFKLLDLQAHVDRRLDEIAGGMSLPSLERRLDAIDARLEQLFAEMNRSQAQLQQSLSPVWWLRRLFGRSS
jgi:glycosyltransferase involved in cell wall biosynthesis